MRILSTDRQYAGALVPLAALTGFLLQADPDQPAVELLTQNLPGDAIGSAVLTLIVGGLLVLVASDYTGRNTRRIQKKPGRTFLYGFGILIGFVVIFFILAITVIGLLVAIPLAIAAGFAFLIWGQLGYLAVGRVIVDDRWLALGVAVGLAFLINAIPVIGALVGFVIGCMGVGSGWLNFWGRPEDRRPRGQ